MSLKSKCRNLVWHGVIGTGRTFALLMTSLEDCESEADVRAWHALALALEPDAAVVA